MPPWPGAPGARAARLLLLVASPTAGSRPGDGASCVAPVGEHLLLQLGRAPLAAMLEVEGGMPLARPWEVLEWGGQEDGDDKHLPLCHHTIVSQTCSRLNEGVASDTFDHTRLMRLLSADQERPP